MWQREIKYEIKTVQFSFLINNPEHIMISIYNPDRLSKVCYNKINNINTETSVFCIQGYQWFQDERLQGKFNEICFLTFESFYYGTSTKYYGFKKEIDYIYTLDHWLEIDTPINLKIFEMNSSISRYTVRIIASLITIFSQYILTLTSTRAVQHQNNTSER